MRTARSPRDVVGVPAQDDYGWADAGWHRTAEAALDADVRTPNMNQLVSCGIPSRFSPSGTTLKSRAAAQVKEGIEMDRQYVYKYCSPTRTAIQSGRNPYHVVRAASAPPLFFLRSSFRCHGRTRSTPGRRSTTRRTR